MAAVPVPEGADIRGSSLGEERDGHRAGASGRMDRETGTRGMGVGVPVRSGRKSSSVGRGRCGAVSAGPLSGPVGAAARAAGPTNRGWRWGWAARPLSSFSEVPEVDVADAWRLARGGRGPCRRAVCAWVGSAAAGDRGRGVVLGGHRRRGGNTWPHLGAVEAIAAALGFTLEIEDEPGRPVLEGVLFQVRRQRHTDGVTPRQLAEFAGVRPNTLYELPRAVAGGSVRTLLVLTHQLNTTLVLVPTPSRDREE